MAVLNNFYLDFDNFNIASSKKAISMLFSI